MRDHHAARSVTGAARRPRVALLRERARTPAGNLALDEALFLGDRAAVRFYGWEPPGLSLGYFQRAADLDTRLFEAAGYAVVRRPTGGGAIAHRDELTFCVVDRVGGPFFSRDVAGDTRRLHGAFQAALARLGVAARPRGAAALAADRGPDPWLCFHRSSPVDLVAGGRKLLGSAARRRGDRVMQHGSLPLGPDPLTPGAASVAEAAGRRVDRAEVEDALVAALEAEYGVVLGDDRATAAEEARAAALVAERYACCGWTARR